MAAHRVFSYSEARVPHSFFVYENGVLELHDNLVMQANTARYYGGAVSLPFEFGSHLPVGACGIHLARVDSIW